MAQTVGVPVAVPPDAFAVFDRQDSGCVSYGVDRGGRRIFVKVAATAEGRRSLRQAVVLHRAVRHPAIVAPLAAVDEPGRTELTYPWVDGVVLNRATVAGSDRAGLAAFLRLDPAEALAALDTILDAHLAVAAAGFVSVDLYDGCFLYDGAARRMRLIDLDEYRPGPFAVPGDRLPGSRRYMAPEEFVGGATIDERTTVFHLGRTVAELVDPAALTAGGRAVVATATQPDPDRRFATVRALLAAWRQAPEG
jgi:serine/threonine-protein kinase